jgi:peptide/nickel transport system permease protein
MSVSAAGLPIVVVPQSPGRLALRRFVHRPVAVAGLVVIVVFVAVAVFAPLLAPYDPIATSWTAIRKAPSLAHWMGTDENGRDVLSRVIFGARASLMAGVVSVLIAGAIGVPTGLLAGFAGGWVDSVLSRLTDAMLACPFLILAIALAAFLGPNLTNAMIAIGVSTAPRFMRVARAATLDASSNDAGDCGRDHRRGEPVVPWAGAAATRPVVGIDAELGAALPGAGAMARRVSGPGHLPGSAVVQPGG